MLDRRLDNLVWIIKARINLHAIIFGGVLVIVHCVLSLVKAKDAKFVHIFLHFCQTFHIRNWFTQILCLDYSSII